MSKPGENGALVECSPYEAWALHDVHLIESIRGVDTNVPKSSVRVRRGKSKRTLATAGRVGAILPALRWQQPP
ncbi:hypothetical protein BST61_g11496 [Cercospora zeina]